MIKSASMRCYLLPSVAALVLAAAGSVAAEVRVFEGFTLIDGNGGTPLPSAAMIVTDGRITWVGPQAKMKAPAGAEHVNLSGKTVIPGIINLHCHLGNTKHMVQDPKNFTRESVTENLQIYAKNGITSVLSMGTDRDLIFDMRAQQRAGRPNTTRIYTAGRGFTGKGGYPTKAQGMKGVPYEVETVAQVNQDVAEQAAKKVDMIKIWVDDHLGKEPKIPTELSAAIIAAAHKHGIKASAHLFYLNDAKKLVAAGLDGIAHSIRDAEVDDELIQLMKKKGAWLAATTLTREYSVYSYVKEPSFVDDPFFVRSSDPADRAMLKSKDFQQKSAAADPHYPRYMNEFIETAKHNLKKMFDAGVNIGFGTDTGPPGRFPGYFEHLEMEFMHDAGLTPMQILTIATKNSARFLGVQKDFGTLEKGKWADFVILAKNPASNIRNTRSLEQTWIAGNRAF